MEALALKVLWLALAFFAGAKSVEILKDRQVLRIRSHVIIAECSLQHWLEDKALTPEGHVRKAPMECVGRDLRRALQ